MARSTSRIMGLFVLLAVVAGAGGGPSNQEVVPPQEVKRPSDNDDTDRESSRAVRVHGVEFRAIVQSRLRVPARGEKRYLNFRLHITNTSDKPVVLADPVRFTVTTASGKPLRSGSGANKYPAEQQSNVLEAGKDLVLGCDARLAWTADGETLRLTGMNGTASVWWFDRVEPGRYLLTAEYDWGRLGKVKTEPVAFEIVPTLAGLRQSRPVRVNGVEFQAVAEAKPAAAREGERRITLGLSITNRTEKQLLFNLWDTREVRLRNAAGEVMKSFSEMETEDTGGYTSPVLIRPRKTETVLYNAEFGVVRGEEQCLSLYDSGCDWYFEGMVPGKYFLSVKYENTAEILEEFIGLAESFIGPAPGPSRKDLFREGAVWARDRFWYGDVWTEEVEFEIVAPKPVPPKRRGK